MSDVDTTLREPTDADGAEAPVLLEAYGVRKSYKTDAGTLDVLRGVDLEIREGEILAILGTSGCGKSTLLHVLGWLDEADEGRIVYRGQDRSSLSNRERATLRNRVMGFVFQFYHLMPELTALENVMLPAMILHGYGWSRAYAEASARATELLSMVGLSERVTHKPRHLSGGERQRVAIARALVARPDCVLMDEPTGNLDPQAAAQVLALIDELGQDSASFVVVTHDPAIAAHMHRTLELRDGALHPVVFGAEGPA